MVRKLARILFLLSIVIGHQVLGSQVNDDRIDFSKLMLSTVINSISDIKPAEATNTGITQSNTNDSFDYPRIEASVHDLLKQSSITAKHSKEFFKQMSSLLSPNTTKITH